MLSSNVFGRVYITDMLVNCHTRNEPTYLNGCDACFNTWKNDNTYKWKMKCSAADTKLWSGKVLGFQWYDVGQSHIVENTVFRNCRADNNRGASTRRQPGG